jgi:uncharacterized membrane protein
MPKDSSAKGKPKRSGLDPFLILAIAATLSSIAYWTAYSYNAYGTFHEYADVGLSAYNMYYYIHYPGNVSGLQWLIFSNHISIVQLLIALPIFYLGQSVMTLLVMQAILLSASGLLLFFIARDLLNSSALGLLFCLALLLNPGMHGMLIFDYHAEDFILPLYLMVFYFFMKARTYPFALSSTLLLGTIEEAPVLSIALGLGLLVYVSIVTRRNPRSLPNPQLMKKMALSLIVASIIVLGAYYLIIGSMVSSYKSTYTSLPPQLQAYPYLQQQINGTTSYSLGGSDNRIVPGWLPAYVVYGLAVALLGFGLTALLDPVSLLIFASPWLAAGLLLKNYLFFYIFDQYFSYVLGGCIAAAILGWIALQNGKGMLPKALRALGGDGRVKPAGGWAVTAMVAIVIALLLLSPFFVLSRSTNSLSQDFLFQVSPQQRIYYGQLDSMISLIPGNAPLLAQNFMMAHLFNREYFEQLEPGAGFFVPQYVLVDFNYNASGGAFLNDQQGVFNSLISSNYTLYASNSTAMLYKHD